MNDMLESRLLGEIPTTSDNSTHDREQRGTNEPLDEGERKE